MLMSTKTSTKPGLRIIALMALGLAYIAVTASPAPAQGFSVTRGIEEFSICPAESHTGSISVTNTSEEPVSLRVFLGDWVRVPGQTSDYSFDEERGKEPRSFVDWMVFSPERMTLEPKETRDVTYEVNVPDDWSLEGSYWGVIFIEGIPSEEPQVATAEEEVEIGIKTVWRYAIQIYATIEGTETRDASFTALNMALAEGGFDAVAVFENRGNIYLKPKVWLEMRNTAGEVVYEQEHSVQTVLPESARDFAFQLRDLPIESGEYLVMIIADYGLPTLIAAQGRVNLTITPPAPATEEGG
jgi:P pilus assembly chaperone PapD